MDATTALDILKFQAEVNERVAKLDNSAETVEAMRILVEQFEDRLTAISIAPFDVGHRRALLVRARNDYLDELEGLIRDQAEERENAPPPDQGQPPESTSTV